MLWSAAHRSCGIVAAGVRRGNQQARARRDMLTMEHVPAESSNQGCAVLSGAAGTDWVFSAGVSETTGGVGTGFSTLSASAGTVLSTVEAADSCPCDPRPDTR